MPPFRIFGVSVCVEFSFLVIVALVGTSETPLCLYLCLAACFLHEMGHLVLMKLYGVEIKRIILYFAGIKIERGRGYPTKHCEGVILLGGCAVNFLLAAFTAQTDIYQLNLFSAVNLLVGIFNLLPIEMLDGGQLMLLLSEGREKLYSVVCVLVRLVFPIAFLICAAVFFVKENANFSVIVTGIFFAVYSALSRTDKNKIIF